MNDPGPHPYVGKTIAEIVHDYAVVRGDLVEQYARDQLVDIIERRIAQAGRDGAAEALDEAADAWLQGAWGNTPRHRDQVADRMAASQYAGDWMRERAKTLRGEA